jgi:hypothetical protein
VYLFAVLRGAQDKDGDEIPEDNCDHDAEQDRRNLFMVLGD